MKKQYLLIVLLVILSLNTGVSQVIAQEPINLGISQMIALAISNNLDYKKASYQLENAQLEDKQLQANNLLNASTSAILQKEITLLQQQNQFQINKDQLYIKVVDQYFELIASQKDIASKKKSTELEKIVLDQTGQQVAGGYSVDLDLLQQGNEYYDALFAYQEGELDYRQLLIEVKDTLGIAHDCELKLQEMNIPDFPDIELTVALEKTQKNSLDLESQLLKVELAEKTMTQAQAQDTPEIEIMKLKNDLGIALLEQSLAKQDLDYQVETQWLTFNQAKNDIISAQKSLQQMQENETIIQQQVEAGLRNKEEALSASIGTLDAQVRLITSVRQAYQAYLELQSLMGNLDKGVLL